MKKIAFMLFAIATVSLVSLSSFSALMKENQFDDIIRKAKAFVGLIAAEKYAEAVVGFDATMTKVMSEPKLKQTWEALIKNVGPLKAQIRTRTERIGKYDAVYIVCEFEKEKMDVKVVFDQEKKIAGLFFLPVQEYKPPQYANQAAFIEREVTVGNGEWELPGTLTLPKGANNLPALVLVHGSGPNDRNESIGPNKPFQDIAWGLSTQGTAVLRYDKRTKAYQTKMAGMTTNLTVKEETIDDALEAIKLLRKTEGIDSERIFILGHSLGGMLVPRIGLRDSKISGFIVLAGPTRPLEDLFLEQMKFAYWLDGSLTDEEKANLEKIKESVHSIKAMKEGEVDLTGERILGARPGYWLDLQDYNPAETAATLKKPMLILQGGRDYQVKKKDFEGWKKYLSSRADVEFKLYPLANHLFIMGRGVSTPAEYLTAGNVGKEVVDDIAKWIERH
jgi:dienelactone hydrolase